MFDGTAFSDYKDTIIKELERVHKFLDIKEKLILVDGFKINQMFDSVKDVLGLGFPIVPVIVCVGETTGRIYEFSLKSLLKDHI